MWLFRISPTRNIKQGTPSLWQIIALRENNKVCARFLGRDNLAVYEMTKGIKKLPKDCPCRRKLTENNTNHELFETKNDHKGTSVR